MGYGSQANLEIGSILVLFALPVGAAFLGRHRIMKCIRTRRWLEAALVWLAYCLVIAFPFALANRIASDPGKAPLTVINMLVVAVCIDGVIRRLRQKNSP